MFRLLSTALLVTAAGGCEAQEIQTILNAASFAPKVAPGTWVAIFGTRLAPSAVSAVSVPFPPVLNGVSVTVNGIAAPLAFVSPGQINALIPFEAAALSGFQKTDVPVVVNTPDGKSAAFPLTLSATAPAVFTKNLLGSGDALALDANFQAIATLGTEPIILYATGLGATTPAARTDALGAGAEPLNRVNGVSVSIGESPATILYAGLAPGLHGIYQLNVVPKPVTGGRLMVTAQLNNSDSLTLPVERGRNVANVKGSVQAVYPAANTVLTFSELLMAASFTAEFDLAPGAKPFLIYAMSTTSPDILATVAVDPQVGIWSASWTVPGNDARAWNFRSAGVPVLDFLTCKGPSCLGFPANAVPLSRVDPAAQSALTGLLPPNYLPTLNSVNGLYTSAGTLPAGGHLTFNATSFGGFRNVAHNPGVNNGSFQLYVDNLLVDTKAITYMVQ